MPESRRVKMTKMLLRKSLLDLMDTKALDKITIKEVCENADINRSTFYSYYTSVEMLYREIENDFFTHLPIFREEAEIKSAEGLRLAFADICKYVEENKTVFRVFIRYGLQTGFYTRFIDTLWQKHIQFSFMSETAADRYKFMYCIHGIVGVLQQWILADCDIPTEEIMELNLRMVIAAAKTDTEKK